MPLGRGGAGAVGIQWREKALPAGQVSVGGGIDHVLFFLHLLRLNVLCILFEFLAVKARGR